MMGSCLEAVANRFDWFFCASVDYYGCLPLLAVWLARWADFKQLFAILSIVVVVFISKFYYHGIIMWQIKVSLHLCCHDILIDNAVLLIKHLRRQHQVINLFK